MARNDQARRASDLADRARALPAEERVAFVEERSAGDRELRDRVWRLLGLDETAGGDDDGLDDFLVTGGGLRALPDALDDPRPDLSGTRVGRFTLVREIGRGGMGVVYEARDDKLQRDVAVKILSGAGIDERTHERFLREARAAAALNHPNVVAIFDAGDADGRPYLVMEYVAGNSLDRRRPESIDEALTIAEQICDALEHAHGKGLVHRDLKPGNVLVAGEGEALEAKLTDMGIALARGAARVTGTGVVPGTPTHMAPEQALGQPVDGRTDLYSLGVMLYGWAAGRPPFDGDDALAVVSQHIHAPVVPPRTYNPRLPAGLEPLILALLAKAPESRPGSAAQVREAIARIKSGEAVGSTGDGEAIAIDGLARGRMVGRQAELDQLRQLWRSALAGRSHLALISGEPGVGKTRLAYEVAAAAQLDGALALTGGCYENEATTPYLPFVEAIRRLVRERDDDDLRQALGDTAAEIARLAPEIESRLGPFPTRPSLGPQEERLRLFDHTARFLRRLAGERGLLVFVDDLQWADHGSLALLHYLLRQLSGDRVLFLATYREIELDRAHPLSKALVDWNRERLATRVRLERLGRDDTARMLSTLLGQESLSDEFVVSLHSETEGNPFFVEEIVKALIAEGGLVHRDSTWERVSTEVILPQNVKSAIGSRLGRVSEACADVLRIAAVLGKHFDFSELKAASGDTVSEDTLLDGLDEATAAQLVAAQRGESFAFTHDKIREVLYDELNPIRRRRVHARIGRGLAALSEAGTEVAVEDLAHHFIEAGDHGRGLEYADEAAKAAERVFAYDEAYTMLGRARDCAEEASRIGEVVRMDERLGDVAYKRGTVSVALEHYERALADATDFVRRNALRCKVGRAYVTSGDPRGLEHVEAAMAELDGARHPLLTSMAMSVRARYAHVAGELERAVSLYRPAIELAEPVGHPRLMVELYANLAGSLQHLAEFDESDRMAERCLEIGKSENLPEGEMFGLEFLGENAIYRGYWERSLEMSEAEATIAKAVHSGANLGWSRFGAFSLHQLGRLAEAERLFKQGVEESRRAGDRRLELFMHLGLGLIGLDQGRADEAIRSMERVVEESDERDLLGHRMLARGYLLIGVLAQQRYDEALETAEVALALWRKSNSRGYFLIQGAWYAEALLRGGRDEEARELLDRHLELAKQTRADHRIAQNQLVRAVLARQDGREDEARELVTSSIAIFETCKSAIELARARGML